MNHAKLFAAVMATACLPLFACQTAQPSDDGYGGCEGGTCDDPGSAADRECAKKCEKSKSASCVEECRREKAIEHCTDRKSDALSSAQKAFTQNAIRWACSDVKGVTVEGGQDDRGQEYCEYYAVVAAPPAK